MNNFSRIGVQPPIVQSTRRRILQRNQLRNFPPSVVQSLLSPRAVAARQPPRTLPPWTAQTLMTSTISTKKVRQRSTRCSVTDHLPKNPSLNPCRPLLRRRWATSSQVHFRHTSSPHLQWHTNSPCLWHISSPFHPQPIHSSHRLPCVACGLLLQIARRRPDILHARSPTSTMPRKLSFGVS